MSCEGCVVCNEVVADVTALAGEDCYQVSCAFCGNYAISGTASRMVSDFPYTRRQIARVRGWLRENQGIVLQPNDINMLRDLEGISVGERAEKLLTALSKEVPTVGHRFEFTPNNSAKWRAHSWSEDFNELAYLLTQYLTTTKQWLNHLPGTGRICVQISPQGYDYLESLRLGGTDRASGFCAMWFGDEMTHVWKDTIRPAIRAAGYEAVRIDGIEHNNKIDDEILAKIRASRFVVADFTGERGGVYFEAGFAMGLGRPVIWTVREDYLSKIHFDNRQYNFIVWKPEDLPDFAKRLQLRIEATIGRGPINREVS